MEQMAAQAEHVGTRIVYDLIIEVDFSPRPFRCVGEFGRRLSGGHRDHRDRRAGAVAGAGVGEAVAGRAAFRPARPATGSSSAASAWPWWAAAIPRWRRRYI